MEVLGAAEGGSGAGKRLAGCRRWARRRGPRPPGLTQCTNERIRRVTAIASDPRHAAASWLLERARLEHTFLRSGCVPFVDGGLRTEH